MKKATLFFIATTFCQIICAQKHDYIWVTGDDNQLVDTTYGGSTINFNSNPALAYYNYRELNLFTTNSSICDTAGNLLFYTNGCAIAGADDEILENGDNINPGSSHNLWCNQYKDGYAGGPQNSLILPLPDSTGVYYLFHKSFTIYNNPFDVISDKLMYSVIDMNQNNSKGKVIVKNQLLMTGALAHGEVVAAQTADSKDWWLVTPKRNSDTFYIFKFTKEGIVDTFQQTIGISPAPTGEGYGQTIFSPDGTKLYRTNPFNPVMVYTFDREAGVITQFDTISYDYGNQPIIGEIGCAVSSNGRFLYLGARLKLFQLDLQAPDVSASQILVAEWDGFTTPIATLFQQLQLAPDCKIYGLAGGDTRYFHVIHNPDESGLSCNVEQRGLVLPTRSGASMPSFPNYRLGPIDNPGVPCTATVGTQAPPTPLPVFSVFPNPVSAALKIVPNRQFGGQARVRLFDVTGRMALEEIFDPQSACTELDVRALPGGMYFYEIWSEGRVARAGKVFKVE
jgi:hypothetical protein